jgi:hypothetical protein
MIKADLNKQIYEEFNRYDSSLQVGGTGGGSGAQLLRDVCFVIDALGEVTKYVSPPSPSFLSRPLFRSLLPTTSKIHTE